MSLYGANWVASFASKASLYFAVNDDISGAPMAGEELTYRHDIVVRLRGGDLQFSDRARSSLPKSALVAQAHTMPISLMATTAAASGR